MIWPYKNPGELRHQITIYRQAPSSDESGSSVRREVFINTYAAIEPAKATDIIRSGQIISEVMVPIIINYQDGILPNMEVDGPHGTYIIQGIINSLESNGPLTLMCLAFRGVT